MVYRHFTGADVEQSIGARFERMAAAYGEGLAVKAGDLSLTYSALLTQSNRVANALVRCRGEAAEPVLIMLDQGTALLTAILGTLRSGNFYVPVDMDWPDEFIAHVVRDSGARVFVTSRRHVERARTRAQHGAVVLVMEDLAVSSDHPGIDVPADAVAYIYYTSGSTGRPKGVYDLHRNVLHNIWRYSSNLLLTPSDRLSLVQEPGFSGAVSSMFCALLNGAAVFPFSIRNESARSMAAWVNKERLTVFHSVPSMFELLAKSGEGFPSLRVVRLEGDACLKRHVDMFKKTFAKECVLANGLGATETGLSCQHLMRTETDVRGNVVPIGQPTADVDMVIVDEEGRAVSDGQVGEIAVRSRYLAAGYWNNPGLTAARFRQGETGQRTYMSGDLGRRNADGDMEFMGRKHLDVRVNGRTVDLLALENTLSSIDGVSRAVVRTEDSRNGRVLAAYIQVEEASDLTVGRLRRQAEGLGHPLPPMRFTFTDGIALDINGKVDRGSLNTTPDDRPGLDVGARSPASDTEEAVSRIVSELLEIGTCGWDDPFEAFGGDSLFALNLTLALENAFAVHIPSTELLRLSTVRRVAARIEQGEDRGGITILAGDSAHEILFCIQSMGGDVLAYRHLAEAIDERCTLIGISQDQHVHYTDIGDLARAVVKQIRDVQADGPYNLCGHCFAGLVAFEAAHQLSIEGESVAFLGLIDTAFPKGFTTHLVRHRLPAVLRKMAALPLRRNAELVAGKFIRRSQTKSESMLLRRSRVLQASYELKPYSGYTMLVVAGARRDHVGWEEIVPDLEFVSLPIDEADPSNLHVLSEPYAEPLARVLDAKINAGVSGRPSTHAGQVGTGRLLELR